MPPLRLPSTPEARAPVIAAVLSAIKETDPGFDSSSLLRDLPGRYLAVRRAAAESDDARLRVYLSPALLEHWSDGGPAEAALPAGAGDLSVQEVRLVWAERVIWEDRLTVGIDSMAMAGEEVHTRTEYWTLARRRGLGTDTGAAGRECPGCGAPVAPGDDVCHYCGSELPGPLRSWLLDRVDQDVDWYEGPPGFVI
jgi:zinc-ribbon domain